LLIVHSLKVLDEKFDEHPYFCGDELGTAVLQIAINDSVRVLD